MLVGHSNMGCGICMILLLLFLVISMLIGPKMLRIEKTHLVLVFLLVIVLCLGLVRNTTQYLYLLLKLNTLLLEVVVHNSCGWNKCWKTIGLSNEPWIYIVKTLVLLIYKRIPLFILKLNTLKFVITLLGILLKKRLSL